MNIDKMLYGSRLVAEQSPHKEKHLFREYAQQWFEVFKKPTVRPLTAAGYAQQLNKYLYPASGEQYLEDITPKMVQEYLNGCKHLAQETQQKQMNVLRMVLDMAVEDGYILSNPVKSKKVHLTNNTKNEREPLERQQMLDVLGRIPRLERVEHRCFIATQALHGMRPCEVMRLKWKDVDLANGFIHIRRNVVHPTRNLPVVGDTKTKLSKRTVAILQIALPYIKEAAKQAHH